MLGRSAWQECQETPSTIRASASLAARRQACWNPSSLVPRADTVGYSLIDMLRFLEWQLMAFQVPMIVMRDLLVAAPSAGRQGGAPWMTCPLAVSLEPLVFSCSRPPQKLFQLLSVPSFNNRRISAVRLKNVMPSPSHMRMGTLVECRGLGRGSNKNGLKDGVCRV